MTTENTSGESPKKTTSTRKPAASGRSKTTAKSKATSGTTTTRKRASKPKTASTTSKDKAEKSVETNVEETKVPEEETPQTTPEINESPTSQTESSTMSQNEKASSSQEETTKESSTLDNTYSEFKEGLNRREIIIRFFYSLLFLIVFAIVEGLIQITTIFQFLYLMVTRKPNTAIQKFANQLAAYAYHVIRYITFE